MGIIRKDANLYTREGKLIFKAGCYPKNTVTINSLGHHITYTNEFLHSILLLRV